MMLTIRPLRKKMCQGSMPSLPSNQQSANSEDEVFGSVTETPEGNTENDEEDCFTDTDSELD